MAGGQERSDRGPNGPVAGTRLLVAGAGVTGRAVLEAVAQLEVRPTVCDDNPTALQQLAHTGIAVMRPADAATRITDFDLVITSPGFPPTVPVLAAAVEAGVPIWGDVELAWRLDASGRYGPP